MNKEQQKAYFHQCLRNADLLIKAGKFKEAKEKLAEARLIDPKNPYIIAFDERIKIFESKVASGDATASGQITQQPSIEIPSTEEQLRHKIQEQMSEEIRRAEELAEKVLKVEREKLQRQQIALQAEYEQRVKDMQEKVEQEFQLRLADEIAATEERLRQQFEAEQAYFEKEMVTRLQENYQETFRQLEQQFQENQMQLLAKERAAFAERERKMKEDFNQRLLEGIRKTEIMFREQTIQQQEQEKRQLREQMEKEFEEKLAKEREALSKNYDEQKNKLQKLFLEEQAKLRDEFNRTLREEQELYRKREAQKQEERRKLAIQQLEEEFQKKLQNQIETERTRIEDEAKATIERERIRLQNEYEAMVIKQKKDIQKVRTDLEQQFTKRLEEIVTDYDHRMKLLGLVPPQTKEEAVEFYAKKMRECYSDGEPSAEHAQELMELKEILELTYDEHLQIETDVRLNLYVSNVEKKILSGELKPSDSAGLEALKQKYSISPEESSQIEHYILAAFQRIAIKGRILVADDESDILTMLEDVLTSNGYQVITCTSVEQALEKLKTTTVDLIVSDIKFSPGEPDGFKFFQTVQEIPHLKNIPFILLSSLSDGIFVRSGVQLGVDDYLTKPIDPDMLLATVEGKLKRYRRLDK